MGIVAPLKLDAGLVSEFELGDEVDAAIVAVTPVGNLAATDAQAAFEELDLEVQGRSRMSGFVYAPDGSALVVLTYNEASRTLTITPTGASFTFYVDGVKFTKTGVHNYTHTAAQGAHFIYYDADGNLVESASPWDLGRTAPVGYIFWDAVNSRGIPFKEIHHAGRDVYAHQRLHEIDGTQVIDGFAATGYTLDTDTDAAITMAIAAGNIADEDLRTLTTALADGGPYLQAYRSGASGDWRILRTSAFPPPVVANRIQYNQFSGGTWQLANVTNNSFVNVWVFALPSLDPAQQILFVPGQQEFSTLAAASAISVGSLAWGTMPFQEIAPLYQLVYEYKAAFGGTVEAQLRLITRIVGTRASITAAAQTDHGALTGLSDLDHPASAIINTPSGNLAATDVQAALNELQTDVDSRSLSSHLHTGVYEPLLGYVPINKAGQIGISGDLLFGDAAAYSIGHWNMFGQPFYVTAGLADLDGVWLKLDPGASGGFTLGVAEMLLSRNYQLFGGIDGSLTWRGNAIWHAGNDGSLSTLDADLLDGQHGSFYRDAGNLSAGIVLAARLNGVVGPIALMGAVPVGTDNTFPMFYANSPAVVLGSTNAAYLWSNLYSTVGGPRHIANDIAASLSISSTGLAFITSAPVAAGTLWTAVNRFTVSTAGAGVFAGSLTAVAGTFSGDVNTYRAASPTTGALFLGNSGARYLYYDGSVYSFGTADLYVGGSKVLTLANIPGATVGSTTKVTNLNADYIDGIDGVLLVNGDDIGLGVGRKSLGRASYNPNTVAARDSGFIDCYAAGGVYPSGMSHVHGIQAIHRFDSGYGMQLVSQYNVNELYFRRWNANTFTTWQRIWHDGNDGAGSTLDADLCDGLHVASGRNNVGNQIVRTNASGYIDTGYINTAIGTSDGSGDPIHFYCSNDDYIRRKDVATVQRVINPASTWTIYCLGNGARTACTITIYHARYVRLNGFVLFTADFAITATNGTDGQYAIVNMPTNYDITGGAWFFLGRNITTGATVQGASWAAPNEMFIATLVNGGVIAAGARFSISGFYKEA